MVCVALTTTTCGSSECRPDGEAEATSRVVALCGAKQGPQGFVADPKKPATFPEQRCRVHVRQDLSSCESEPWSAKKKAGRFRVLTYLAESRQAASWFASHRLQGSMAWLNVIPKLPQYQVSLELFRIMLGTATLMLVVGDMKVTKCVYGYHMASQLCTGMHWCSSCLTITLLTTMHNEVAECWQSML